MNAESVISFVASWWLNAITLPTTAQPVTDGRLSDWPLWHINAGEQAFALRGWPSDMQYQAQKAAQFAMAAAKSNHFAVPVPLPIAQNCAVRLASVGECDGQMSNHYWELAPWLAGESNFSQQPTIEKLCDMCRALAVLHKNTRPMVVHARQPVIGRYGGKLESLLRRTMSGELDVAAVRLDRELGEYAWVVSRQALCKGADIALTELRALADARLRQQWIWGDAWHNNFLLLGKRVEGLVDFATVRIDTPTADIARLLGSTTVTRQSWWDEGLAAYRAVVNLSPSEMAATVAIRDCGTVLSLANWLVWLGVETRPAATREVAQSRLLHFAERMAYLLERGRR